MAKIKQLKDKSGTEQIFPKTKTQAIYNTDGTLLSETLDDLYGSLATIESSPTTTSHSVGEYILYEGQVYKVTSVIASGDSLVVGTNISAVNLGNQIDTLNGQVSTLNSKLSYNNASIGVPSSEKKIITPVTGCSSYPTWGGCFYYKVGTRVHVHIGVQGLTANTYVSNIGVLLPEGYRPPFEVCGVGSSGTSSGYSNAGIFSTGTISVVSTGNYCLVEIEYDVLI